MHRVLHMLVLSRLLRDQRVNLGPILIQGLGISWWCTISYILYKENASKPIPSSATVHNNDDYAVRLGRSITPIPDRQFIMKNSVARNMK